MRAVYKQNIQLYPTYFTVNVLDQKNVLEWVLGDIEVSMFGINRFSQTKLNEPITRMQMTKWIVDSFKFNYFKLIKEKRDKVKSARLLKTTGKGSTDKVLKLNFIDVGY